MNLLIRFPTSLIASIAVIMGIPAIAYGSLQMALQASPDIVYTTHGDKKIEWAKLSEANSFTEYMGLDKKFDEETLTADILVLRSYHEPQSSLYEHERVSYSSMIIHQTINCRNRSVTVQDVLLFSKFLSKGRLVKDLYDLDYEIGEARAGTIDEKKVSELCSFTA